MAFATATQPIKKDNRQQPGIGGNATAPALEVMERNVSSFLETSSKREGNTGITDFKQSGAHLLDILARNVGLTPQHPEFVRKLYDEIAGRHQTPFSVALELMDPTVNYEGSPLAKMDAFERQLYFADIRTKTEPSKGIFADNMGRFFQSNIPGSSVLYPEYINRVLREELIAPDTLAYLLANTTGVDSDRYRSIFTNDTVASRRMYRVGQGAELPQTTMGFSEHYITLFKYGRLLKGTYEFFRQIKIDQFAVMLRRIAMQAMLDKADTAIDVLINGDNNSNPATNYNQSTLDTGATPTYSAFLAFMLKFYPYTLTTIVGNEASLVKFLSMARPSIDPFQVLAMLTGRTQPANNGVTIPQPLFNGVQLVLAPNTPTGVLVGLDRTMALEQVIENGSNLVETDKFITNQTEVVAISEKVGFAKLMTAASATWTWNA